MATKSNIVIEQGTDFSLEVNVGQANGAAFDLTNYTAAAKLKKHWSSSISYPITALVSDAIGGEVTISANNTVSGNIVPSRYYYSIEVTSNTGTVTRVVEGIATVTPGIT
jgi:hypothetical protein